MNDFEKDKIIRSFLHNKAKNIPLSDAAQKDEVWTKMEEKRSRSGWIKGAVATVFVIAIAASLVFSAFGTFKKAHNPNISEILAEVSNLPVDESDESEIYDEWEELGEYVELQREKNR